MDLTFGVVTVVVVVVVVVVEDVVPDVEGVAGGAEVSVSAVEVVPDVELLHAAKASPRTTATNDRSLIALLPPSSVGKRSVPIAARCARPYTKTPCRLTEPDRASLCWTPAP
jgi:hypothetical protein